MVVVEVGEKSAASPTVFHLQPHVTDILFTPSNRAGSPVHEHNFIGLGQESNY